MGVAKLISVEEYLSTSYEPECDYVDGELEDRNVGEKDHSKGQMKMSFYLYAHREQWKIAVWPEQRIRVSPTRYRVPDICVTLGEPDEQVFTKPPFLCIEFLSPEDRPSSMQRKIDDYLRFGVRFVWVLDPWQRQAFIHTLAGVRPVHDRILRTSDPDITVPLSAIFEG